MIELINGDCMPFMANLPDNAFDLAIVDPPYGINATKMKLGEGGGTYIQPKKYKRGEWDSNRPNENYFKEIIRCSANQIVWGGNYFADMLNPSPCWVVWDKNNGETSFADCELAWTSFNSPVRKYKFTWSGYIQDVKGGERAKRIHPTQKPVKLYEWLLKTYANPTDTILDTHLGSGSSAIAAHNYGHDFTGIELDKDYFNAASKRLHNHKNQLTLEL